MGELGTFQVGLSGKGAVTSEDYDTSLIRKARINFRPGLTLAGMLSNWRFSKVAIKYPKEADEEEGGDLSA